MNNSLISDIYQTKFIIKHLFHRDIEYFLPTNTKIKIPIGEDLLISSLREQEGEDLIVEIAIFVIKRIKRIDNRSKTKNPVSSKVQNNQSETEVSIEEEYDLEAEDKVSRFLSVCSLLEPKENVPFMIEKDLAGTRYITEEQIGATFVMATFPIPIRYEITEKTKKKTLKNFLSLSNKSINLYSLLSGSKDPFLNLAIEYYYRSKLVEPTFKHFAISGTKMERQFLDLVMCLECLFNEGSGDISYKLIMRATFLYCLVTNRDTSEFYTFLDKVYKIRNNLVHGTLTPVINSSDIIRLQESLSIILRAMIGILLSQDKNIKENNDLTTKKSLLKIIDLALLDKSNPKGLLNKIRKTNVF